jgi:hypothetical protein
MISRVTISMVVRFDWTFPSRGIMTMLVVAEGEDSAVAADEEVGLEVDEVEDVGLEVDEVEDKGSAVAVVEEGAVESGSVADEEGVLLSRGGRLLSELRAMTLLL